MKKFLIAIGVVVLILLILPAVLPDKISMARSIEINAPIAIVFSKLTDLNEYVKWNPFPEGDPTNTTNISGEGIGANLVWKGDKTGEGKMTITSIEPEQKIGVKMEFYKPMTGEGMVYWTTKSTSDVKTEMTWIFEQDLSYFNRYFGLFMDAMMGKHFEKGLSNYKTLVEASK